ncbi:MAG TPA: YceI family protein [Acidobacteriaceae bacterium]|nr:YceI family protein [Acidobacteriaceae bacterium]
MGTTARWMKGTWMLAAALAAGAGMAAAQVHDWTIDKAHSDANFAIKHMAISTVRGSFRGVSGTIRFDPGDPTKWAVDATIDVTTVDTGVARRDADLKSANFFDTAKYPTMTFKSTGVKKDGSGYALTGDLTMHGVTKPVTLALESPGKEQVGNDGKSIHRGFTATTTLNRKDFGLSWNGTLKSGDAALGDDVKIELDIEAVQAQPAAAAATAAK